MPAVGRAGLRCRCGVEWAAEDGVDQRGRREATPVARSVDRELGGDAAPVDAGAERGGHVVQLHDRPLVEDVGSAAVVVTAVDAERRDLCPVVAASEDLIGREGAGVREPVGVVRVVGRALVQDPGRVARDVGQLAAVAPVPGPAGGIRGVRAHGAAALAGAPAFTITWSPSDRARGTRAAYASALTRPGTIGSRAQLDAWSQKSWVRARWARSRKTPSQPQDFTAHQERAEGRHHRAVVRVDEHPAICGLDRGVVRRCASRLAEPPVGVAGDAHAHELVADRQVVELHVPVGLGSGRRVDAVDREPFRIGSVRPAEVDQDPGVAERREVRRRGDRLVPERDVVVRSHRGIGVTRRHAVGDPAESGRDEARDDQAIGTTSRSALHTRSSSRARRPSPRMGPHSR